MYLFSIYLFVKLLIYIKIDSCIFIYILGYNKTQGYILHVQLITTSVIRGSLS